MTAQASANAIGTRVLYVAPEVRQFGPRQGPDLDTYLNAQSLDTSFKAVSCYEDLALDGEARTMADGLQYTSLSLLQLTHYLARGLGGTITDLAGIAHSPDRAPESRDLNAAIQVFNAALRVRLPRVMPRRMIIETRTRLLVGFLSPTYQFMSNPDFFTAASEAVEASEVPTGFGGAQLVGRRLQLWYRSAEPVFELPVSRQPQSFWAGYYFCNGEATDTSLHGSDAVYNRFGAALGSFGGRRTQHAGTNFRDRAQQLFIGTVSQERLDSQFRRGVMQLLRRSLGVRGSMEEREARITALAQVLSRHGISRMTIARDIVNYALFIGRDPVPVSRTDFDAWGMFPARTGYDLFCALLRRGKRLGPHLRERIEHVAYELLFGRIRF